MREMAFTGRPMRGLGAPVATDDDEAMRDLLKTGASYAFTLRPSCPSPKVRAVPRTTAGCLPPSAACLLR